MEKIPEDFLRNWEKDFTLALQKEYEDALYRLIRHDITGKYQLNRYFTLPQPYPAWQVSVDFKDKTAEQVIRYFWQYVPNERTTAPPGFKDDKKIIFEETGGRVREFCEEFYRTDPNGYLIRDEENEIFVSPTILINDMVRKGRLEEEELLALLS